MLYASYTIRTTCAWMAWEQPRELSEKSPLVEGPGSWNSPGHGSVDSQSCGIGVTESSCRDWVHWLTLPTKRGLQSERVQTRGGGREREEKGEVHSAQ